MKKLQTVLDALEQWTDETPRCDLGALDAKIHEAITIVKEMMAQEPVAWADDKAIQGRVGNVCSTAAKRYWEKSDFVDKKNAELHKYPLYAAPVVVQEVPAVTDEMVSRFLCWKLPRYFYPDSFISFDRTKHDTWGGYPNSWPTGTNLFTGDQARAMLEHVIAAAPVAKGEV